MVEREAMREREVEASEVLKLRDARIQWNEEEARLAEQGRVVIKGKHIPFFLAGQGYIKAYVQGGKITDIDPTWAALKTMHCFIHEIRTHSGRHVHQGGFSLFVLQGRGYTVVDGVRHDWEEGDLILLPIKPGGCEHQHFNLDPERPSRWLAMQHIPLWEMVGRIVVQRETNPDYKGRLEDVWKDIKVLRET
jgi:hypothetical protein